MPRIPALLRALAGAAAIVAAAPSPAWAAGGTDAVGGTAQGAVLVVAVLLIVAGVVPIVRDLARMRAPLGRGASTVTEIVWAALPIAFLGLLVALAVRAL